MLVTNPVTKWDFGPQENKKERTSANDFNSWKGGRVV
jgi:hypothetical protein